MFSLTRTWMSGLRQPLGLFTALAEAHRGLSGLWWALLLARAVLPPLFTIATGILVAAVHQGDDLTWPLVAVGTSIVLVLSLGPLHEATGEVLGHCASGWMRGQLTVASIEPEGIGHLEDPELKSDVTVAQDMDRGITGPPLSISLNFLAGGLAAVLSGVISTAILVGYSWWAPLLLAAGWLASQWLLRDSAHWRDRLGQEVREAERLSDYTYRLAVDAAPSKEMRLFGLSNWALARFGERRRRLFDLRWQATRMRERPAAWSVLVGVSVNVAFFWSLAARLNDGAIGLGEAAIYAQSAIAASALAFGDFLWVLDGAAAPANAVLRLRGTLPLAGGLSRGWDPAVGLPRREIRFRDVTFTYPSGDRPVLRGFNLVIPAGTSLAIVGQNGAGKTTLAKLLCRFYDPQGGTIEVDGVDLRELDLEAWRGRLAAVFQDFVRFELPLRDNVSPLADEAQIARAIRAAGAADLAGLDTVLSRAYAGGTDLSGGQWQRVALARAVCAVEMGAGVVLLDEPTAQLDVRGETEIFDRILAATSGATTILVSHRFSTVRHADRICVVEDGRVIEQGSHEELVARGGRYFTMFSLQASRFAEHDGQGVAYDVLS